MGEAPIRDRYRKTGAILMLVGLLCGLFAVLSGPAGAASGGGSTGLSTSDPNVDVVAGGENCSGVVPTPGSENTLKTLTGGTLEPGGTATFQVSYPLDAADVGEEFEIVDCVLMASPPYPALNKYTTLDEATFSGVAANQNFALDMLLQIPSDVPVGTQICNVAKTTEGPTAPQQSNRKAGPACFIVGGDVRIEKRAAGGPARDPDNPDAGLLTGAVFNFSCVNAALDPVKQPLVINGISYTTANVTANGVTADDGAIELSGASGSTCTVTEVTPPSGYNLPAVTTQNFTIQPGTQVIVEFRDPAVVTTTTTIATTTTTQATTTTTRATTTTTQATTTTTRPVVLCCVEIPTTTTAPPPTTTTLPPPTTTTAAPAVLPLTIVATTVTAPPTTVHVLGVQLARTGDDAAIWVRLAGIFLVVGGLFLLVGDRRVWSLTHRG